MTHVQYHAKYEEGENQKVKYVEAKSGEEGAQRERGQVVKHRVTVLEKEELKIRRIAGRGRSLMGEGTTCS